MRCGSALLVGQNLDLYRWPGRKSTAVIEFFGVLEYN